MLLRDIIKNWKNPLQFDSNVVIRKRDVIKILEGARWAPSAENQQVWRFLVIDDDLKKKCIIKSVEEQDPRLTAITHEIVPPKLTNKYVFSTENFNSTTDKYKGLISNTHQIDLNCAKTASIFIICTHSLKYMGEAFGSTDIGAAIANMLLISKELGYHIRIIRNFHRELVRTTINIPDSHIIDIILAAGISSEEDNNIEKNTKKYRDFYFHNQWGQEYEIYDLERRDLVIEDYKVNAIDAILDRRSIRKFERGKKIPDEIVFKLMEASMITPLTILKPYIKLIIIDNKEILSEIAQFAKLILAKQPHVQQASMIIAIAYDCTNNSPGFYAEYDTGMIIQNILLRAHSLGIGSCWIGAFNRKNIRKIVKVEDDWHIPSLAIFGYPNKYPKPTPRVALGKIGYYNAWKNGVEKKKRELLPNYHVGSIIFRKLKKTRVKTPLRMRNVGIPRGIPEFEKKAS